MDLIDTHVHLMHPELFAYPWCADNAALQRRFNLEDYRVAAAKAKGRAKIQAVMFMEADVPVAQQAAETEFFARLADKDRGDPPLLAVIASATGPAGRRRAGARPAPRAAQCPGRTRADGTVRRESPAAGQA